MRIPNFFIVGAAKAGTTSLYYYLKQHPDIYMSPVKEPHYFAKDIDINKFSIDYKKNSLILNKENIANFNLLELHSAYVRDFETYKQLFKHRKNEKVIGEASVSYLYSKVAAKEIYNYNPNAKILIILRDPIERAFSHYLMNLSLGLTTKKDFIKEVMEDYEKKEKGWGISHLYIELGLYSDQIKRYLEIFPKENIKIVKFEMLKNYTEETLKDIFKFLGVENSNFKIDLSIKNASYIPTNPLINRFLNMYILNTIRTKIRPYIHPSIWQILSKTYRNIFFKKNKPILTHEDRIILLDYFINDIKKVEDLTSLNLKNWLK